MAQLIISVDGLELTEADKIRLRSPLVAGVILFTRNYRDKTQLTELTAAIKACSPDLLICVDQEGGRVQRFVDGFTVLPPGKSWESQYRANAEQATRDLQACAQTMLTEIRACGVDMSLVPCLDIDWGNSEIIGDRSFSSDPGQVTALAGIYIDALKADGMPVTGKHFPGHGYVTLDSHLGMPVDERSWNEIKATDAKPYQQLIDKLDLIMTAHIAFPAVDERPVTFSHRWLQSILRDELGYQGVIVSDCLTMIGAAELYPDIVERVNVAHDAGCDLLFLCNSDALVDELLGRKSELNSLNAQSKQRVENLQAAVALNPVGQA